MPRSRYRILEPERPHFLTATINHWVPIFTRPDTVDIVFDSWRFLQDQADLRLYGYVILENHLHLVAQSPDLPGDIRRFKSYTARRILDWLNEHGHQQVLETLAWNKLRHKVDSDYQLWDEGSHPQLMSDDNMLRQKLDYIHHNPVKRGYVDRAEHWRYSSARDYAGQPGLIDVYTGWMG